MVLPVIPLVQLMTSSTCPILTRLVLECPRPYMPVRTDAHPYLAAWYLARTGQSVCLVKVIPIDNIPSGRWLKWRIYSDWPTQTILAFRCLGTKIFYFFL